MKKLTSLKAKVTALVLAITMAMSSVTAFAATENYAYYNVAFKSYSIEPNTVYYTVNYVISSNSTSNYVNQTTSATYSTSYWLVTKDAYVTATNSVSTTNGKKYFTFKSDYGGAGQSYRLAARAQQVYGRPSYSVSGSYGA